MQEEIFHKKLEEVEKELSVYDGELEVKLYGCDISGQSIVKDIKWLVTAVKELKEENDNLIEYKKAFEASKLAGAALPYIPQKRSI